MSTNYREEAFELAVKHAGCEILSDAAGEAADNAFGFKTSREFENNINKLIDADIRRIRARKAGRIALRITAVFLVLIIVSSIAIFSSEALRVQVYNLFLSTGEKSTDIDFQAENPGAEGMVMPSYIPDRFVLKESTKTGRIYNSIFEDSSGKYLVIEQGPVGGSLGVDSEGVVSYKVKINNREAIMFEDTDKSTLVFNDDKYFYLIFGNAEPDELVKIAESMPVK